MDDSDLVQRYKEKAREWIFQKSDLKYTIEDDEILDLDSLNLGSDDDTWLYSSDETSRSVVEIPSDEKDFSPRSSDYNEKSSINFKLNTTFDTSEISPLSPLIDFNKCSDSLVHIPDVSLGTVDNFFNLTPMEERKSKSYLRTALCNQFRANHINVEEKNEFNAFQKPDNTFKSLNETVTIPKKTRPNNELADKSYILHSVENKLFTITDADTNETFSKTTQSRDARNQKVVEDDPMLNDDVKSSLPPSTKASDQINAKEHEKKLSCNKPIKTTPENDENDHRSAVKKTAPICQSTPMLLGRYLKYNKTIDDSKQYSKWRTSAEFLKDEANECGVDGDQHPLNVSYIKDASPILEDDPIQVNNSTFSKMENYCNSTYEIHEDDQASSTSESSVSSFGNKPAYSIRDVQKNAELQERNLKQFQPNFGAGSSKSSEISSSNESISAFSPISSSNEGHIDTKTNATYRNVQKLSYSGQRPHTADNRSIGSTVNSTTIKKKRLFGDEKKVNQSLKVGPSVNNNTSDPFRSKLALATGSTPPKNRQLNKYEQNTKNFATTVKETSKFSLRVQETTLQDGSQDIQNATFTSKLSLMKAPRNYSPSKERKSSDDLTKIVPRRSVSPNPVSHIPRPSSRIPKLRSSSSCTRYSNYNSLKK